MALFDAFLKIEGVAGESTDSKHQGEIELLSFDLGESHRGASHVTGAGLGAGRSSFADAKFTAWASKASPKLMEGCASGEHYKKAVLTCRKAGKDQQEFLKVTFSDVLISNYQIGGSSGSPQQGMVLGANGEIVPAAPMDHPLPMDQLSLNFAKIEIEYKEQKADGTLGGSTRGSWDLKKNVK